MPLTINVGYSEKLGQPEYGSIGASCHVECELDGRLVFDDPDEFHAKVRELYSGCTKAVQDELASRQADLARARAQLGSSQAELEAQKRDRPRKWILDDDPIYTDNAAARSAGFDAIPAPVIDLNWVGGGLSGPTTLIAQTPFTLNRTYTISGAAASEA